MHALAQKMCYLLKLNGIEIGDFSYSWNFRGPFSPGLLALLRSIDMKQADVSEFYQNENEKQKIISVFDAQIAELKTILEIGEHSAQVESWVKLLGSLAYLSRTVLPGSDFETVNERLIKEMPEYNDKALNNRAWNILKGLNLIN